MGYKFLYDSFSGNIPVLERIFASLNPRKKLLEIGSFEGRSAVWLIDNVLNQNDGGDLYCIDPWDKEWDDDCEPWLESERRFDENVMLAARGHPTTIHKLKGKSIFHLSRLIANNHANSFDCVYVDGSHQAAEVLSDLALAFELVRKDGILICDDYLWKVSDNPLHAPKLAIDAFTNIYFDKVSEIQYEPNYQRYFIKRHGRIDNKWSREYMLEVVASS